MEDDQRTDLPLYPQEQEEDHKRMLHHENLPRHSIKLKRTPDTSQDPPLLTTDLLYPLEIGSSDKSVTRNHACLIIELCIVTHQLCMAVHHDSLTVHDCATRITNCARLCNTTHRLCNMIHRLCTTVQRFNTEPTRND
jgi:hypothetical protein